MHTLQQVMADQLNASHPKPGQFARLIPGMTIVFSRTPLGSWISAGDRYVVEWKTSGHAYFRNQASGGGTFDASWAIERSEFTIISKGE